MKGDRLGHPWILSVLNVAPVRPSRPSWLESYSDCELWIGKCAKVVVHRIVRILAGNLQVQKRVLVAHRGHFRSDEQAFHQRIFNTEVDAATEAQCLAATVDEPQVHFLVRHVRIVRRRCNRHVVRHVHARVRIVALDARHLELAENPEVREDPLVLRVEVILTSQLHHQAVRHSAEDRLARVDVFDAHVGRRNARIQVDLVFIQGERLSFDEVLTRLDVHDVRTAQVDVDVVCDEILRTHGEILQRVVEAPRVGKDRGQVAADVGVAETVFSPDHVLIRVDAKADRPSVFLGKHVVQSREVVEELARSNVEVELPLSCLRSKHTLTTLLRLCQGRHNQ